MGNISFLEHFLFVFKPHSALHSDITSWKNGDHKENWESNPGAKSSSFPPLESLQPHFFTFNENQIKLELILLILPFINQNKISTLNGEMEETFLEIYFKVYPEKDINRKSFHYYFPSLQCKPIYTSLLQAGYLQKKIYIREYTAGKTLLCMACVWFPTLHNVPKHQQE